MIEVGLFRGENNCAAGFEVLADNKIFFVFDNDVGSPFAPIAVGSAALIVNFAVGDICTQRDDDLSAHVEEVAVDAGQVLTVALRGFASGH